MDNGSKNPLKLIREDVLRAVIVTLAVAFSTGFAGAVMDGTWRRALLAICGVAVALLVAMLIGTAWWHSRELEEVKFEDMRAKDAWKRGLAKYERDQREHMLRAARRPSDAAGQKADLSAMLERARKHISSGRASPIELLLISDENPYAPSPVAQAGSFDQAVLHNPVLLVDWIDGRGETAYGCPIPVNGKSWRVFGISETPLNHYDKFEIQRVASHVFALKLAHGGEDGSLEETA